MEASEVTPHSNLLGIDQATLERFLAKVDLKSGGCWNWTGYCGPSGHGYFRFRGRPYLAHRLSYELAIGPIPDGNHVHHRCENSSCVNPAHLEAVTPHDHVYVALPPHPTRRRKANTHCSRGHEYNAQNTRMYAGSRQCKICANITDKMRRDAYRAEHPLSEITHCIHGHPLSGDNLYLVTLKNGLTARRCKECNRRRAMEYASRHHEKVLAAKNARRQREREERQRDKTERALAVLRSGSDEQAILEQLKSIL